MKQRARGVVDKGKDKEVALGTARGEEDNGEDDSGLIVTATKESPALLLRFQ